ncbi:MAG: hypothetical protein FJY55_14265 [Betaproteobacteria bacterium]|nr:hypothetical protein [Betaproteobacteria bacterium]MBM3796866.1 hypothetical protein [Acidobacteriota bacterium]
MPEGRKLRIFLDVCSAVKHAHRSLVVHCDLKPDNILVTADGRRGTGKAQACQGKRFSLLDLVDQEKL